MPDPDARARRRWPNGSAASRTQRQMPALCAPKAFASGSRAAPGEPRCGRTGDAVARHVQQLFPSARRRSPRRSVLEAAGYQVVIPDAAAVLRPAALRLGHARHGQARCWTDLRYARRRTSTPARRSSAWSRPASSPSATSCPACSQRRLAATALRRQTCLLSEFLDAARRISAAADLARQGAGADALSPSRRHEAGRREARAGAARARLRRPGVRLLRHGRLVRLRDGQSTTSRSRSAERVLLPRSARRARRHCHSPTASAAASRSSKGEPAGPSTSPNCWPMLSRRTGANGWAAMGERPTSIEDYALIGAERPKRDKKAEKPASAAAKESR